MKGKTSIIIVAICLIITSCNSKKESETIKISLPSLDIWGKTSIQQLPFSFYFDKDSILDYHYTLGAFENRKMISKTSELNSLFSDSTSFLPHEDLFIIESNNYPYKGEAYYYKRLPDVINTKVLLFIYQNREEEETLPYFEIQTYNEHNQVIDKMILAGGINRDCSWDRKFSIDTDYKISITDVEACYDLEFEKEISNRVIENKYQINNNGLIAKQEKKAIL